MGEHFLKLLIGRRMFWYLRISALAPWNLIRVRFTILDCSNRSRALCCVRAFNLKAVKNIQSQLKSSYVLLFLEPLKCITFSVLASPK